MRLCLVGVPGSGKTTTSRALAEYFEVPLLHSSRIAIAACPGDWVAKGQMAPEPCTTLAVERELEQYDEWVLDGFPRSAQQLRSPFVKREAIVYLDISTKRALERLKVRGRAPQAIEYQRVREQTQILAPVRQQSAVIIPVTFRTPSQVVDAVIRWYLDNIHPNELGSNAR